MFKNRSGGAHAADEDLSGSTTTGATSAENRSVPAGGSTTGSTVGSTAAAPTATRNDATTTRVSDPTPDRRTVVDREREEHGGVKVGSAFFGFLAAFGVGALLTALVTAAGVAVGLANGTSADEAKAKASDAVETVGLAGGIVLLVVLFVAYYCGGYVAARMARFDGVKQGLAVWVWALVIAVAVAILGAVAGDEYNILKNLDSFPRIPVDEGDLTNGGIIAAVLVVVVSLLGAMAGGLAGMRFHRAVDRTGLGA